LLRAEAVSSVILQWFFPGAACADAAEHFALGCAARRPPQPTVTRPPPPASVITATIVAGACSVGET
jgi:hypothetical protein